MGVWLGGKGVVLGEREGGKEQVIARGVSVHQLVFCPSTVAFPDTICVTVPHGLSKQQVEGPPP